jgi:hypothetical protein|tara:strand:- start:405 stop:629 length:225 start_codon:yes stop_codon:yes gene_type:complete
MKRQEATLLGYKILYNRSGNLISERLSTDIKELKPYFKPEEYATLQVIMRECTQKLDEIHSHIENCLNSRIMGG